MIENAPSGPRHLLAHWKFGLAGLVLGAVAVVLTLAHLAGILTVERHRGFFAPVWAADSNHVYLMERRTSGIIWGFGWEHFTPPAYSYVLSDRLSLVRFNAESGALEVLEHFDGGPVQGRITRHYRNRIFNTMSARLLPMPGAIDFRVRMDLHKVPRSEPWSLSGVWRRDRPSAARWVRKRAGNTGAGDHVLRDGLELILIKGREAFPAAIIAANADGSYRVLIKNGDFDGLYPDGVPARMIAQRTRRKSITRIRARRRAKAELMAKYRTQGLNEEAASLRAHDDMEARGLYPKSPRLVATLVVHVPVGIRVFDIPAQRFQVGLYQDIARAMAKPGAQVKTSTGTYLKYAGDNTGPELKAWRRAGNDRFAVRTGGKIYLLRVHRSDR